MTYTDSHGTEPGRSGVSPVCYVPARTIWLEDFIVHRTRLGVICDSFAIPDRTLGGCLVQPADWARSGLDGLALAPLEASEKADWWKPLRRLKPLLKELDNELAAYRPRRFWAPPWKRKWKLAERGVVSGALGAVAGTASFLKGLTLAAAMPIPAVFLAGGVAYATVEASRDTPEQWQKVLGALREFARVL